MLKNIGWSVVAVVGLGLAWLASSLGEGWALWLVGALLAAVSALAIGARVRHRRADAAAGGLALQAESDHCASQVNPAVAPAYSPKNVGNDASARPW